jgi:hypothetical protein
VGPVQVDILSRLFFPAGILVNAPAEKDTYVNEKRSTNNVDLWCAVSYRTLSLHWCSSAAVWQAFFIDPLLHYWVVSHAWNIAWVRSWISEPTDESVQFTEKNTSYKETNDVFKDHESLLLSFRL